MEYSLSSSLVGGSGSINPDGLSLDLNFAADKTLTARRGPTPSFTRANTTSTFVGSNGTIQNATTNIARFDHDKSYSSAYLVLSGSPVDVNSNAVDIASPIEFVGWDESSPVQFPLFNYSNLQIGVEGDYWLVYANNGDFIAQRSIANGINGAYTIINGSGTLTVTAVHPCKGLLIEEQRQNLLTNTNGDLSTQTQTVTAVQHTLSFYGTGQIVLSGAATAVVSPAGNYGDRKTLTFTPSAGSLILTVTGSVEFAQLEIGAFATSFIPTSGTSLIRSADVCSITGTDFTGFYNQTSGSVVIHGDSANGTTSSWCQFCSNANGNRAFDIRRESSDGSLRTNDSSAGSSIISSSPSYPVKFGVVSSANGTPTYYNGAAAGFMGAKNANTQQKVTIGSSANGLPLNGCIRSLKYYRKIIPAAKMLIFTAP
jgi:hypothetical protein